MAFKILLATRNPGKVAEIQHLLAELPVTLLTVDDLPEAAPDVEEDQPTLEGNAQKKAEALHAFSDLPALADDTGLEVAALDGRPGVYSARYAGPDADPLANRAKMLREMDGVADRRAHFRTVLAFADAGEVHYFEGRCEGVITEDERGTGGFGYDAIFLPTGETRTFAQLSKAEKNAMSHRGRALQQFVAWLHSRIG